MLAYSLVVTFPGFQRSPPSGACFKMGMDFYISKLFSCMFLAAICVGTGVVALDMMLWVAAVLAPLTCVLLKVTIGKVSSSMCSWVGECTYVTPK